MSKSKWRRILFLIVSMGCVGCSQTYRMRDLNPSSKDFQKMVDLSHQHQAMVTSTDGRVFEKGKIGIEQDSIRLFAMEKTKARAIPLQKVRSIRFHQISRGAVDGLWIGMSTGVALGALIGFNSHDGISERDRCIQNGNESCDMIIDFQLPTMFYVVFLGAGIGLVGGLSGLAIGALSGHQVTYMLPQPVLE